MAEPFYVIIAGPRDFKDFHFLVTKCDQILKNRKNIVIVSGKCSGADQLGEYYARMKGYPIKDFPAQWRKNGKLDRSAGPRRNRQMAEFAHALIAFWDGISSGTKNMIETAREKGLLVREIRFERPLTAYLVERTLGKVHYDSHLAVIVNAYSPDEALQMAIAHHIDFENPDVTVKPLPLQKGVVYENVQYL